MSILPERKKKRYICSFVKLNAKNEYKPNVVVIPAHNEITAKAVLCEMYQVPPSPPKKDNWDEYVSEGVKSVRLAETNLYEGGSEYDNFRDD